MPRKREAKHEKPLVSKKSAEEIFEAIRNPAMSNIDIYEGDLDDGRVTFIGAERDNGKVVPLALIMDKKANKILDSLVVDAREDDDEDEEEDEDYDEEEDEDDGEVFTP